MFASIGLISPPCGVPLSTSVYFPSSMQAGQRYSDKVPQLAWFFEWGGAIAASLTNAVFNWAEYYRMGQGHVSFLAWLTMGLLAWTKNCKSLLRQCVNLCTALGSIIPFWYISLTNNTGLNILYATSAMANVPVFYSGADSFYEVMSYAQMQKIYLYLTYFMCFYDTEEFNRLLEYTEIKTFLTTHLLDLADDFRLASPEEKTKFIRLFSNDQTDINKLSTLLRVNIQDHPLPHVPNLFREQYVISYFLSLLVFLLGVCGMVQNFGHIVEAYRAGAQYHWTLGVFLAVCNAIPGLGFTIKGILGVGLLNLLVELCLNWKKMQCSYIMMLCTIARICYVFSGFSGDELNYQSVLYFKPFLMPAFGCTLEQLEIFAFVIGLMANIGTALVFNGPQCERLLKYFFQTKPTSHEEVQHQEVEAQLYEYAEASRALPLSVIEDLMEDEQTQGVMLSFFQHKKSNVTISTAQNPLNYS